MFLPITPLRHLQRASQGRENTYFLSYQQDNLILENSSIFTIDTPNPPIYLYNLDFRAGDILAVITG